MIWGYPYFWKHPFVIQGDQVWVELRSCALDRAALERRTKSEGEWNLGDSKGDHHWFLMGCCVVGMDVDQNGQKKMS